jgi:quinol monooxygenase YgiN
MYGLSSVLFTTEGREDALLAAMKAYAEGISRDPDLVYVDCHQSKYPYKFVLIEMYGDRHSLARQEATEHGRAWAAAKKELLTSESTFTPAWPMLTEPKNCARPYENHQDVPAAELTCLTDDPEIVCGVYVRVFPKPHRLDYLIPAIHRANRRILDNEPGFGFIDFMMTSEPGEMIVVEYYKSREYLSIHHEMQHTQIFGLERKVEAFEWRKHDAFTMRPVFSMGRFPRRFKRA